MYTIFAILLLFLLVITSILLYLKQKNHSKELMESGECPSCGAKTKSFTDDTTGAIFNVEVIRSRILKNHGCSGVTEVEYRCNSCGRKEIHLHSNHCNSCNNCV